MRIIFVSNNWDDSHQQTRLSGVRTMGLEVIPLGFKRKYYKGSSEITPLWLGFMAHGSYYQRLAAYFHYVIQLSKFSKKTDWVYVFGFDIFIITSLVGLIRGFRTAYEITDIREVFFRTGFSADLLRFLEKIFVSKAALIVTTSEAYVTEYFYKIRKIRRLNYLTIENKIQSSSFQICKSDRKKRINSKIRIGYFGLLRCPLSLQCLMELGKLGKFEIVLRGIFMPQTEHLESMIMTATGLSYGGPYNASVDSENMYNDIDICWAAYPFSNDLIGNHLFARTNRYYESMFYKCPMILQNNSADYRHAMDLGLKVINLDSSDPSEWIKIIDNTLSRDFLAHALSKQMTIEASDYIITDEYIQLLTCLQQKK